MPRWWVVVILVAGLICSLHHVHARDLDGHYAAQNPELHAWFNHLKSGKGLCCSFADGVSIGDVDWSMRDGHYIVKIPDTAVFPGSKDYLDVPDAAVVSEPNRFGPAVVWPYFDGAGAVQIRCFMPGAGT